MVVINSLKGKQLLGKIVSLFFFVDLLQLLGHFLWLIKYNCLGTTLCGSLNTIVTLAVM